MNSDENVSMVLKRKRENLGLSMQEVSNLTGISISHISRIEKGVRLPGYKIFEKLNELYGIGYETTSNGSDSVLNECNLAKIPLVGVVKAGLPTVACQDIEEYLKVPFSLVKKIDFALRISGDSMNELNIKDGDIVFIKQQPMVENGEIAVVLVDGEDATIKQFYHQGNNVTLIPRSKNPIYSPLVYNTQDTEIRVVGKVVSAYVSI